MVVGGEAEGKEERRYKVSDGSDSTINEFRFLIEETIRFSNSREERGFGSDAWGYEAIAANLKDASEKLNLNSPLVFQRNYKLIEVEKLASATGIPPDDLEDIAADSTGKEWSGLLSAWNVSEEDHTILGERTLETVWLECHSPRCHPIRNESAETCLLVKDDSGTLVENACEKEVARIVRDKLGCWIRWLDAGMPGFELPEPVEEPDKEDEQRKQAVELAVEYQKIKKGDEGYKTWPEIVDAVNETFNKKFKLNTFKGWVRDYCEEHDITDLPKRGPGAMKKARKSREVSTKDSTNTQHGHPR